MSEVDSAEMTFAGAVPLLRIFLSSPGDVADERNLARNLIKDQLPYLPGFRGRVSFDVVAWDDPAAQVAMFANETPQESLNRARPRPATCQITVVILWSRLGTPLPESMKKANGEPYASGTEWEYLDACSSPFKTAVLVYRRTEEPNVSLKDPKLSEKAEQFEKVESFFSQFRNADGSLRGGVNEYDTPTIFRDRLRMHLEDIVWQWLKSQGKQRAASTAVAPEPRWTGSPYPGLRPFLTSEAPVFFGRGKETDALIKSLRDTEPCFVTVVGDSGTGKSSLVYAGVLPRLEAGALDAQQNWLVVSLRPAGFGDDPFLSLAAAFIARLPEMSQCPPVDLANALRNNPQSIRDVIARASDTHPNGTNLVVFVDQLEELFSQCSEALRSPFVEVLASAVFDPRCRIIATLRADFLPAATRMPLLQPLLQRGTFPLGPLGPSVMVDVIRRPAAVAGVGLDDDLVDTLLVDAGDDRGALPLMAFCLQQLYSSAAEHERLSLAEYEQVGGLRGALGKHADAVIKRVEEQYGTSAHRELASIFALLVTVDVSGRPTRQRAPREALTRVAGLVDALIAGRLLVESAASSTVELAHEALFECWPELATWIGGNRADLLALTELAADASRWERSNRDENYLLRGSARLQQATQLRDQHADWLTEAVRAFLDDSISRARAEESADQQLSLYEQLRTATLLRHVKPFLERRMKELESVIYREAKEREHKFYNRYSEEEEKAKQEISEIENLLDRSAGKWHPESANIFRELGAEYDLYVWDFPCCGRKVLGSDEPSQFRSDGCATSPSLRKGK